MASYEKDLKAIADLRDIYVEALEDFIDLWVESSEMLAWKEEILSTEKKVRDHALAIRGQAVLLTRKLGISGQQGVKGEDKRDDNLNDLLSRCDLHFDFKVSLKLARYDRYLKSGCLDIETFGVQESLKMNNFTIEEEMENIDAQNAAKVETKVEALTHESSDDLNQEQHEQEQEHNEDSTAEDSEKIRGSASSSVNIDAEDCTAQGTKRISVRSTRQNFFSIETFSPRYN